MYSAADDPKGPGFPIRKSTDQRVLAPPRSLSQRATSFIASVRQGIHQMPLKRLIQRNPSRPGVSPAFPKKKREPSSALQRKAPSTTAAFVRKRRKCRQGSLVSAKTKPNPERELIRLRYSSLRPKGKAEQLKTRQEVSQSLPSHPAKSQAAESLKSPLTTQFRSTLSNNTTGSTGQ